MADRHEILSDFPKEWMQCIMERGPEPQGFVRLRAYNPERKIWKTIFPWDKNLVVNSGRDAISDQLSGAINTVAWADIDEARTFSITRALVGDGGHGNPGPGDPFPPGLTDKDLGNFLYERPLDAILRPTEVSVGFQFSIPAAGPNLAFSEFGLGTLGDLSNPAWTPAPTDPTHKLVTRKTFGFISKIAGWEYQITWIIVF